MLFVKPKSDSEKLQEIEKYCIGKIQEHNQRIEWLKANQTNPLDYGDEIHEYQTRNAYFEKIIEIVKSDGLTSILIV